MDPKPTQKNALFGWRFEGFQFLNNRTLRTREQCVVEKRLQGFTQEFMVVIDIIWIVISAWIVMSVWIVMSA